jgi:hypothetical protein
VKGLTDFTPPRQVVETAASTDSAMGSAECGS